MIILRACTEQDASELFPLFSNKEVIQYTNFKQFPSLELLRDFLHDFLLIGHNLPMQYGPYVIIRDEVVVGFCGLQLVSHIEGSVEIWYLVHQDFWHQGIASDAIKQLMEKARSNKMIQRVCANALTFNIISWQLLEKAGFKLISELPNGFQKGDFKADLRLYEFCFDR
jgi:ribosomal-protein-alanine N-acetyltransferase